MTEELIRAAIARAWSARPPVGPSVDVGFSDAFSAAGALLHPLWDPEALRPSELERLDELVADRLDAIRDDARRAIVEALVAAALAFDREHPDAPRRAVTRRTP